jgi:ribonuclease P protein component
VQRDLRLRHAADFERLWAKGQRFHHQMLLLGILPNGLPHNRYGFVTGKRIGKAVTRNRLRRQLREIVCSLHPHFRTGYDVVFVARPALVGQPFLHIRRIIEKMALQSGLLVESDVS